MKCQHCGKEFEPTNGHALTQKFCSRSCKNSANRKRHSTPLKEKVCLQCGKTFLPKRSHARFCSLKCCKQNYYPYRKLLNQPKKKICKHCGKEFIPNHSQKLYCSVDCRKAHKNSCDKARRNQHFQPETEKLKICPLCKKEFSTKFNQKKYCSVRCAQKATYLRRIATLVKTPLPEKICPACGKSFSPTNRNQKCCCTYCSNKLYKKNHHSSPQSRRLTKTEQNSLKRTGRILAENIARKKREFEAFRKKNPTPKPAEKMVIPAAVAQNREPTDEEILAWIFRDEVKKHD